MAARKKQTSSKNKTTAKKASAPKKKPSASKPQARRKKSTKKPASSNKRISQKKARAKKSESATDQQVAKAWMQTLADQSNLAIRALSEQNQAALRALAEEHASALHALSAQNAAAMQAMSETTGRLAHRLDVLIERVDRIESALTSVDAKLEQWLARTDLVREPGYREGADVDRPIREFEAELELPTPPFESPAAETAPPTPAPERPPLTEAVPELAPRIEVRDAFRPATSLADLMRVRAYPENRRYLDSINGKLGTALGFHKEPLPGDSEPAQPAVLVFVPQKINRVWIRPEQRIKSELTIPGDPGIRCPLSVVEGSKASSPPEVQEKHNDLLSMLRGRGPTLWCGSQLAALDNDGRELLGSLGGFVRRKTDGKIGFITNDHVSFGGSLLFHPNRSTGISVGFRTNQYLHAVEPEEWYGPFAAEIGDTKVRVDCEFLRLDLNLPPEVEIRPELPTLGKLGPRYEINLTANMLTDASPLIGAEVLKIGRTTGLTYGRIWAFGYEWKDEELVTRYTDFLIAPDRVTGEPFSQPGDSGSLVVMKNGLRPVALMWGGYLQQLRGQRQESWTYATRLDRILDNLGVELLS